MMSVVVVPVVPVVNPSFIGGHFPIWFSLPVVIVMGVIICIGIVKLIKMRDEL